MNVPQEIRNEIAIVEAQVSDGEVSPRKGMADLLVKFPILMFDLDKPNHPLTFLAIQHGGKSSLKSH